jgi:hypothetical protein
MGIELLIRTDSLRKLLEEEPEAKIRLQNMAIEKIAEELKRKTGDIALRQFEVEISNTAQKTIASFNKEISSKYKFPPEAKAVIEELAKQIVQDCFKAELRRWETNINQFFSDKQKKLDELVEQRVLLAIDKMRPVIKQQAREEFISVLESAKSIKT